MKLRKIRFLAGAAVVLCLFGIRLRGSLLRAYDIHGYPF